MNQSSSAPLFRKRYKPRKAKAKHAITAKHINGAGRSGTGPVCFLCDRERLKLTKSGGDSFRDQLMRRKGLITPEDDREYDARQVTFRAKVFPRTTDARTRKIDEERRARKSGGFTRAGLT